MKITVSVVLEEGDAFLYTADAAAAQVIAALGGNPTKDYCALRIETSQAGDAGTPPPPPPVT